MKIIFCIIYILFFVILLGCSKEERCLKVQMDLWKSTATKSYKKCFNPEAVYIEKSIPGYQKVYTFQGCGQETYDPLPEFKSDAVKKCVNN